ncbi:MAG: ead/Ea22-like family protein [Klebsiella pneumoniae]|uniref:ead/Ea22-like family protein n=1 Tax=Klebsiella pneumoniae TaxID=573 RepID=UPI00215B0272|nr:ead/Ea22-like family protein [Klebsiella pneumoniae]MDU4489772.1 ead/Ea22-like family protein [Klebsiella pneumoniae]
MTTDITELAQGLKAAAENAIGAHERLAAYPYGEIIDISQHEGEQIDIDITDINEFHEEANPVNVLALVEALDKAQQQMTESENRVRKQNRHICELFDDNTALRQRIAELESRTVTVKMPKPHAHLIWIQAGHAPDDYWDDVAVSHSEKDRCCDGSERYPVYARWEIEGMLTAAGIKWEAE